MKSVLFLAFSYSLGMITQAKIRVMRQPIMIYPSIMAISAVENAAPSNVNCKARREYSCVVMRFCETNIAAPIINRVARHSSDLVGAAVFASSSGLVASISL